MDTLNKDTQFKLVELKEYVDHFGDNLVLASSQITVESKVGFSTRPMSLQDILKMLNKASQSTEAALLEHAEKITENNNILQTKADATISYTVDSAINKLEAIEAHLKREEDTGINVII